MSESKSVDTTATTTNENSFNSLNDENKIDSSVPPNPVPQSSSSFYYYVAKTGSLILSAVDYIGNSLASILGITDSHFQYVIDAQDRMEQRIRMEQEEEEKAMKELQQNIQQASQIEYNHSNHNNNDNSINDIHQNENINVNSQSLSSPINTVIVDKSTSDPSIENKTRALSDSTV